MPQGVILTLLNYHSLRLEIACSRAKERVQERIRPAINARKIPFEMEVVEVVSAGFKSQAQPLHRSDVPGDWDGFKKLAERNFSLPASRKLRDPPHSIVEQVGIEH